MIRLGLLFLLLSHAPASAHDVAGTSSSGSTWTFDLSIVLLLCVLAGCYLIGSARLWQRVGFARGTPPSRLACFWSGWTILALALLSPLHLFSEQLLSAHMIEHELIMAVAAPLLVLSRPLGPLLWAFPDAWRRPMVLDWLAPLVAPWDWLTIPAVATVLHAATIWAWHAPLFFDAALANPWLHMLQHVSFLVGAILFWWAILRVSCEQLSVSALHLFMTMIAVSALGALIALSPHLLYVTYRGHAEAFGLTSLDDQQLAGLIMWIPGCAIYAAAALIFFGRWIVATSSHELRRVGIATSHEAS
jgi:cytochrome c oxidase assembly factor CtaG